MDEIIEALTDLSRDLIELNLKLNDLIYYELHREEMGWKLEPSLKPLLQGVSRLDSSPHSDC